jgi:anhydro-N-acetylmuramic acid kinase
MNKNIRKLSEISSKETKKIIGLMSGTSLDGLDIALCDFQDSGINTKVKVENFTTLEYSNLTKKRIRSIFSKKKVALQDVCIYNSWLGNLMGKMVLQALQGWNIKPDTIDCIASHGQTIYHAPKSIHGDKSLPNSTLQLGDSDHIARTTGIITIGDFRQKHTAAGGEGAPLAAYGDFMIFNKKGEQRILLNIGGIGNFTFLDGSSRADQILSTDTGPGNTLIDAVVREYDHNKTFDKDGKLAAKGTVNQRLLAKLMEHPFYKLSLPKSTGPEVFNLNYVKESLSSVADKTDIKKDDLIATLTMLTVHSISKTIKDIPGLAEHCNIFISGGGAKNKTLIKWLQKILPKHNIHNFDSLGVHSDAKEAVLFALLANETLTGDGIPFKNKDGKVENLTLGKISFPH